MATSWLPSNYYSIVWYVSSLTYVLKYATPSKLAEAGFYLHSVDVYDGNELTASNLCNY